MNAACPHVASPTVVENPLGRIRFSDPADYRVLGAWSSAVVADLVARAARLEETYVPPSAHVELTTLLLRSAGVAGAAIAALPWFAEVRNSNGCGIQH
jgi:hypothetical protein